MKFFESKNGVRNYNIIHSLVKILMLFIAFAILSFAYDFYFDGGKRSDLQIIQNKLKTNKNIEVLKLGFKDEGVVLAKFFATIKTSSGHVMTLHDLRPEIFTDLGVTTLLRVGDWGVVTLKISPREDTKEGLVYSNGFRLMRDEDFLAFTKNQSYKTMDDLINRAELVEQYVLTLPELKQTQISEDFYLKHVVSKDAEYGFGGKRYFLRWRFKSNYLGDFEKSYGNEKYSRPTFPKALHMKIKKEIRSE